MKNMFTSNTPDNAVPEYTTLRPGIVVGRAYLYTIRVICEHHLPPLNSVWNTTHNYCAKPVPVITILIPRSSKMNSGRNPSSNTQSFNIPFTQSTELHSSLTLDSGVLSCPEPIHLPGQPSVPLEIYNVLEYLEKELVTPKLNKMAPHMWLLATPSSSHISPLHDQIVRGRNIVISENPELHLVWFDNRVFIKPLPIYLLSHAFWEFYLLRPDAQQTGLARSALGYLRSYFHLVRHESDYRIAIEKHLIPEDISYHSFMTFIAGFGRVQDGQVSARYYFGQLRMTRLNLWSLPLLGESHFHKVAWQYADILARYYAPYLFVFSIFSVILSAMQVGVGARSEWTAFQNVSAWFSVVTLVAVCIAGLFLGLDFFLLVGRETIYAFNRRFFDKKTGNSFHGTAKA